MKSGRFKIPLIYITAGIFWITFSDSLLVYIAAVDYSEAYKYVSICKGIAFVLFTGLLLFFLLNKERNKMKKDQRQYRNLFVGNPNAIWFYDPASFRFIDVNDAAIARYGYTKEEFLSMTIFDIRPHEDTEKVKLSYGRMHDHFHESGTWRHVKKDGSLMYVNISSHKTRFNDQEVVMVMALDKTEKYLSEQQNKRTGEMLSKIDSPVIVADSQGLIVWVNPSFTNTTGYTEAEVLRTSHLDKLYSSNTSKETVQMMFDAVAKRESFTSDLLHQDKSGKEYWASLNLSPLFDSKGELEYYISVQNDITEHKKKETVIGIQNEKLKAVSLLNSHQIRKPVASILALTQLMKSADSEEEKEEILGMLHLCAVELDEIILEINAEATAPIH